MIPPDSLTRPAPRRGNGRPPELDAVRREAPGTRLPDALHGRLRVPAAAQEARLRAHRLDIRVRAPRRALRANGASVRGGVLLGR